MLQFTKTDLKELLMRLRREGVSLWEENGSLRYKGPEGVLKDSDLQIIEDYKMNILDLLQTESKPTTVTSDYSQKAKPPPDSSLPELKGKSSNAVLTNYGGGETGTLRVIFHAAFGTMNCFRLLIKHLKSQNLGPVIGITVADVEKYCEIETSELIEQIANDYAERLWETGHREMQLIGYCLGGLTAIEVARRLLEKGIHLSDLVLVDARPLLFDVDDDLFLESLFVPNLNINFEQAVEHAGFGKVYPDDLSRGLLQIFEDNNKSIPKGSLCKIGGDEGLDKVGDLFQRLDALSRKDRFKIYLNAMAKDAGEQMPLEMAEVLFMMFRQSTKAARLTPPPYMGDIRFLKANEPSDFFSGMDEMILQFWKEICLGEFKVTEIEGNHLSCIEEEPNVTNLARLIAAPLIKNYKK